MRVSLRLFAAMPVLASVLLAPARSADAAVFTLQFTGTYDTLGQSVFGQSGSAVPFSYSLTYDTALDTDTQFYAAGSIFGEHPLVHDFYGYSGSGIVDTNLTFGTHTWTADVLAPSRGLLQFALEYQADLSSSAS